MHQRAFVGFAGLLALLPLGVYGCDEEGPVLSLKEIAPPDVAIGSAFDPDATGTIHGRVTWAGAIPQVQPFRAPVSSGSDQAGGTVYSWPNPHAPSIDPATRGVADAVVFLRGVLPPNPDPGTTRPCASS